jgi:hypothetical protein
MESEGSEKKAPKEDLAHVITPLFFICFCFYFFFLLVFSFRLFGFGPS